MNKVIISDLGATYLRKGQMWMYSNNLESDIESFDNGEIVEVYAHNNEYLGTGLLSKKSHITVRLLTNNKEDVIDFDFFKRRILKAYKYREEVEPNNLSNCRLIFGEADYLPGLTVDRYNNILVTQITSFGFEIRKDMIYKALLEVLKENGQVIDGIYERNDLRAREKEGLKQFKGFYNNVNLPTDLVIKENDLLLNVDIKNGQKTGYFLDQKSNRLLLRKISKDKRVLDCFCHTGGFGLNAALGEAKHVTCVDVSKTALDEAKKNAELNNLTNIEFVQADVFDYLDSLNVGDYDIIVLDPPAFTKSRSTVMKAYNGYKRINKQAMNVLRGKGILCTCSCSRYMETSLFEKMLEEASSEANVKLNLKSVTYQNPDHPMLKTMDETTYLKFFVFEVE